MYRKAEEGKERKENTERLKEYGRFQRSFDGNSSLHAQAGKALDLLLVPPVSDAVIHECNEPSSNKYPSRRNS